MAEALTKPCEQCGIPVTRTATQQSQRKYWTCSLSCANMRRIQLGNTPNWAPNPLRGQRETRPCSLCEKPVTRYLSQVRTTQTWTCSKSCAATLRGRAQRAAGTWKRPQKPRRGDTIPCSVCGTPFYRVPAYVKQGRHLCSPTCVGRWQSKPPVVKACAHCGTEMTLKPSQSARQYCSRRCLTAGRTKWPLSPDHLGRPRRKTAAGYVLVWEPSHPNKALKGWQWEHRLIMEAEIGRYLTRDEQVDHVNEVKDDNRLDNLQVLSATDHSRKTNADKERARAKLLAEIAAYREKYGPLME